MVLAVTSAWAQTLYNIKDSQNRCGYNDQTLPFTFPIADWVTLITPDCYEYDHNLIIKSVTCDKAGVVTFDEGTQELVFTNPSRDAITLTIAFDYENAGNTVVNCTNYHYTFTIAHKSHTISSTEWQNYMDGSNKAYHYRPCTDNTSYCEMSEPGSFTSVEATLTSCAECTYDDDDDYICNDCGFENESRKPAFVHTHDFSPNWTFTEETTDPNYGKHWHECLGYGADATCITTDADGAALADHTYGTHKHETSYYTCSVCYFEDPTKKTEYTPHVFEAAWTTDATYHWHKCTADGYDDACLDNPGAEKGEHVYGTTGDARFTCQICGAEDDTKKPHDAHTYATTWTTDATNHWKVCTAAGICDAPISELGSHVYGTDMTQEAYYKCSTCDYVNHARQAVATNKSNAWSWTYEIPHEFNVAEVVNDRQLIPASNGKQAYTICLPYDLTLPASVEVYTLSASKDEQVGFAKTATNEIKALTPYLIIPTGESQLLNLSGGKIVKTDAASVTAKDVTSAAVSGQQTYTLKGSMSYIKGDDATTTPTYIMQSENKWKQIEGGSYDNADPSKRACILPMRAYLVAAGAASSRLFSFFDQTTGIQRTVIIDADSQPVIYDLQGRKVTEPRKGGLYIVNGKKMLWK